MNDRSRLIRKVLYLLGVFVLLVPIAMLSAPGVLGSQGQLSRGGKLAQIRHEYKLSQANLGEIDPAGETMKLATVGLKGIAVNLLWSRANEYKMKEQWDALRTTLDQIRTLVPNFVSVWQFQAWNLSYNVSVEFDDYHDRYRWVIKGINFLRDGVRFNANNPPLLWDMGWTIAQKIGRADEHVQFRRLFKADDDFHGPRRLSQRDNWLVGQEWFQAAERVVDDLGVAISGLNPMYDIGQKRGKSPLIFFSDAPKCQMNYAEAMEEEGTFGEVAQNAWKQAAEMWGKYGNRDLATTYNVSIRLNDKEQFDERAKQAIVELEALLPKGEREKAKQEKIDRLSNREKTALNTPADKRNADQQTLMYTIEEKIKITPADLADRVKGENRSKALELADKSMDAENRSGIIDRYRQIVNFEYWRMRANMERTDNALAARRLLYQAKKDFDAARISESVKLYEEGFRKWRAVLDEFPALLEENTVTEDLADQILEYRLNLEQLERKLPDDFPLQDVLDREKERMSEPAPVDQTEEAQQKLKELGVEDAEPAGGAEKKEEKEPGEDGKEVDKEGAKSEGAATEGTKPEVTDAKKS